jgi:hypothetical protein
MRRVALYLVMLLGVLAIRAWSRDMPAVFSGSPAGLVGVFHIHSDTSHDGRVPYAEMVEAGREISADFLVFTEHNVFADRAQPADGPLVVSGIELSTRSGHLHQLGLDTVPEPAMRDSAGLIDFIHSQGGLAIAAHPESPKRPWDGSDEDLDGLEIASTSSDVRHKTAAGYPGLAAVLAVYPLNPSLAMAQLYRRDDAALARWDARPDPGVVGLCGTDTHGWVASETQFRTWQIVLDAWDPPRAAIGPDDVIERLGEGRFFCVAGLLDGTAAEFRFTARGEAGEYQQGATAALDDVSALEIVARRPPGSSATMVLLRDGEEVGRTTETRLTYTDLEPGTYRVEIWAPIPRLLWGQSDVPVLYSNRIRLER